MKLEPTLKKKKKKILISADQQHPLMATALPDGTGLSNRTMCPDTLQKLLRDGH